MTRPTFASGCMNVGVSCGDGRVHVGIGQAVDQLSAAAELVALVLEPAALTSDASSDELVDEERDGVGVRTRCSAQTVWPQCRVTGERRSAGGWQRGQRSRGRMAWGVSGARTCASDSVVLAAASALVAGECSCIEGRVPDDDGGDEEGYEEEGWVE